MQIWELLLIALGLAMDAFAVAVCMGLASAGESGRRGLQAATAAAGYFGVFQAAMPLAGYFLARWFAGYIQAFDHWIAFALLAFIGLRMAWEGWRSAANKEEYSALSLGIRRMVPLALATSVDAMAVGVTFALRNVSIWATVAIIGAVTAALSAMGLLLGRLVGDRLRGKAEIVGGVILVGMGIRILVEGIWGGG